MDVYDFSVDYNANVANANNADVDDIKDIHKYLIKKKS